MRSVATIMKTLALISVLVLGTATLTGCSGTTEEKDETLGWSPQRMYSEAKEAMGDGAYERAIKLFEKLEARYPYGRYAQQAQLEVAYAYYRSLEPAQAIASCERFIRLHPNHPNVDYAYYLKGLVDFNEDLGLMSAISRQDLTERDPNSARNSFESFRQLVLRFPDSKYAPDARLRMNYLVNALASHEVHVARYYLKRGAPIAAANRAKTALTTYPEAPATEEALFIMVKSYDLMGLVDLRNDAERVMRKNFPNSIYFNGGKGSDEPWWKLW